MRAFWILGTEVGEVVEIEPPTPGPGEVIVDITAVGICGTDVGLFHADAAALREKRSSFPLQPGHEWVGRVREVGSGVPASWLGRRVVGDPMLGCGRCPHCRAARFNLCPDRQEIGTRGGYPGALAEQLRVPVSALRTVPTSSPTRWLPWWSRAGMPTGPCKQPGPVRESES